MTPAIHARITAAVFDSDLIATRIILALAEALWSASLLWPGPTFDRPTYTGMGTVMHENAWGLVFALTAVTQISIVAMGHFGRTYARIFAGWNAVLWVAVNALMWVSVYPPPAATSGEIALAVAAFWVWFRPVLLYYYFQKSHATEGAANGHE